MNERFLPCDSRRRLAIVCWICCAVTVGCAPAAHYAGDGRARSGGASDAIDEPPRPAPANAPSDAAPIASGTTAWTAPAATHQLAKQDVRPEPRDSRPPRQRALLIAELQGLEALARETPVTAPDHPELLRRLAEDYVELQRSAHADGAASIETSARTKAIQLYARLASDHPKYPKLDEVLFFLATEFEQAGDLANARKAYMSLTVRAPDSRYVPDAYLAFGEMFFDEAVTDPSKFDLAAGAYQEVLKYPPPRNRVYGYACYKLAWVLANEGDRANAIEAFNRAIEFAAEFPLISGAQKLGNAARADLASLQSRQSE
ncbi:MAG: tetratricopeptide repeat protein [Polyangiaceae bacterium]